MRADAYNFDLDTQWEILPIKGVVVIWRNNKRNTFILI